jgi:hypothetical protein
MHRYNGWLERETRIRRRKKGREETYWFQTEILDLEEKELNRDREENPRCNNRDLIIREEVNQQQQKVGEKRNHGLVGKSTKNRDVQEINELKPTAVTRYVAFFHKENVCFL